jgi:EAL domain-containing protein (putative c-di-GMP-specific phosphodiesterase class I)
MRQAESALATAQQQGHGGLAAFSSAEDTTLAARRMVMFDLPDALRRGELRLRYQPQFSGETGRLVGVEALLRWQHPEHGLLLPERFIAAAEASGWMGALGEWVLREACQQARQWRSLKLPAVPMAVNVSAWQLQQPGFLQTVQHVLDDHGLPPHALELEVSESTVMSGPSRVGEVLAEGRRLGLRISLDDFGTGHANLATLLSAPVDQIKIDGSFIARVPQEPKSAALVSALIRMARDMGIGVVAEGVETAAQLDFLKTQRCNTLQGFLLSKPLEPWTQAIPAWGGFDGGLGGPGHTPTIRLASSVDDGYTVVENTHRDPRTGRLLANSWWVCGPQGYLRGPYERRQAQTEALRLNTREPVTDDDPVHDTKA